MLVSAPIVAAAAPVIPVAPVVVPRPVIAAAPLVPAYAPFARAAVLLGSNKGKTAKKN